MSTPAKYDDLNTPTIAIVGVVSAIATFVLIVGFQAAYYYAESATETAKAKATGPSKSETILAEQRGKLASYAWAGEDSQQLSIPIDQAMTLVLREEAQAAATSEAASIQ